MARNDNTPRPMALVATRKVADETLATAVREDLLEMLQFIRMRVTADDSPDKLAKTAEAHDGPCVLTFSDVAGIPVDCVEGALETLEDTDVVLGPCADGSVYLLAFDGLETPLVKSLIEATLQPDGLQHCIALIDDAGLEALAMPPWFRISTDKDLSFAESLTRLSLMSEGGENDFMSDRLRLWFEQREQA